MHRTLDPEVTVVVRVKVAVTVVVNCRVTLNGLKREFKALCKPKRGATGPVRHWPFTPMMSSSTGSEAELSTSPEL